MARFISSNSNTSTDTASSTVTMTAVASAVGDLLVYSIGTTLASAPTFTTPSGWTQLRTDFQTDTRAVIYYKFAASTNEAFPSVTMSASALWVCMGHSFRGVNGTPIGNVSLTSNATGTTTPSAPTVTTTADYSKALHLIFAERYSVTGITGDSYNNSALTNTYTVTSTSGLNQVDIGCGSSHDTIEFSAGTSTQTWNISGSAAASKLIYAIEIKSDFSEISTILKADPVPALSGYTIGSDDTWRDAISAGGFDVYTGAALTVVTFDASLVNTTTEAITVTAHGFSTGTIVRADANGATLPTGITDGAYYYVRVIDANTVALRSAETKTTGSNTNWYPGVADANITAAGSGTCKLQQINLQWHTVSAAGAFNQPPSSGGGATMSNVNYFGDAVKFTTPVDLSTYTLSSLTSLTSAIVSTLVVFIDSSNNFKTFEITDSLNTPVQKAVNYYASSTAYTAVGGTLNAASIKYIVYLTKTYSNSARPVLSIAVPPIELRDIIVTGGTSTSPITWDQFFNKIQSRNAYSSSNPSLIQYVFNHSITFGSGDQVTDTPIYFQSTEKAIAFPDNAAQSGVIWNNFAPPRLNFDVNAASSVTLKNSLIGASATVAGTVDAARPSAATIVFAGSILNNVTLTLTQYDTIASVLMIGGAGITHNDATLAGWSFQDIDRADGYVLFTTTHNITDAAFTSTVDAGDYAIEIDTAGDYEFVGFTYSGFTTDINVTAASGTVNITVTGGDTPTYQTAGATVNILTPVTNYTLQFPNIIDGSRFQIYNVTQAVELTNSTTSGGTGIDENYIAGTDYDAADEGRYRITYQSGTSAKIAIEGQFTFPADTTISSLPTTQVDDDVYNAYAVDGSTITEFTWDSGNIQVDIDDADNTTTIQRIGAWMAYFITTSTGIAEAFGAFTWSTLNSIEVNVDLVDLQLDNTKATPLLLTGGRIFRDDGGTIIASASNSIQIDYSPVYTVETGVSGLTAGESASLTNIDSLAQDVETGYSPTEAWKLILAATAGKVSGAGTTTITFRDVNDSKDRITATVDASGNRTAVTKDVT